MYQPNPEKVCTYQAVILALRQSQSQSQPKSTSDRDRLAKKACVSVDLKNHNSIDPSTEDATTMINVISKPQQQQGSKQGTKGSEEDRKKQEADGEYPAVAHVCDALDADLDTWVSHILAQGVKLGKVKMKKTQDFRSPQDLEPSEVREYVLLSEGWIQFFLFPISHISFNTQVFHTNTLILFPSFSLFFSRLGLFYSIRWSKDTFKILVASSTQLAR